MIQRRICYLHLCLQRHRDYNSPDSSWISPSGNQIERYFRFNGSVDEENLNRSRCGGLEMSFLFMD